VDQVLADGIRCSLIPGSVGVGLFSRENFDETAGEVIELIRLRDVTMQRCGIKLSEEINAFEPGVQAIGNRNIDNPIFTREGNSRFGAVFGQRKEPGTGTAAEDYGEDTVEGNGFIRPGYVPLHGSVMSVCFGVGKQIERNAA